MAQDFWRSHEVSIKVERLQKRFICFYASLDVTKKGRSGGHVTSSLQAKLAHYVWTREETDYYLYK